ncbi:MAG TPA: hypothetical protein VG326_07925 [Tepidisphaeraceae bacterium]|jgi:hypothetical protein|nr:hypothetical protein [Tepidisphaeraceae bacterium]
MKKINSHVVLLAAAAAAVLTLGWVDRAAAQYPAPGQDGHANDASNRVGSNGYNGRGGGAGSAVSPDNIVNRNVTGLSGFSGPIHERDPRAFTGPVPGGNDVFVRQSSGVASSYGAPTNRNQPQPFYGDSRYTAPPAGSLPVGFNGGYIGTTLNTPSSLSNGLNTATAASGLQSRTENRDTLLLNAMLNPNGYGGLTSTLNDNAALQAASFYGQRTLPAPGENDVSGQQFSSQLGVDDSSIARMRQELRESAEPIDANAPQKGNAPAPSQLQQNGQPGQAPTSLNQPLNQALGQPLEAPVNSPLTNGLTSPQLPNQPLSSTGIIPSNVRERPSLIPANMQSTLLDTLQQRLERTTDVGKAMAEARGNAPQPPTPAANARNPQGAPPPPSDEGPVKVSRLATGVKAKGLHDLLAGGEDLITAGKYESAIAKFNQAQRVAPNNPLAILGRANAELAGGFYARAEQDLRLVFRTDRELLLAQFDLKSLFPKDRVDYVRNDLNDLAASDPKAVRPWFLMAYLDYNTGKPASAEADLNEAEKRSGPGDWSIRLMKRHWVLPSNPHPAPAGPRSTPVPAQ